VVDSIETITPTLTLHVSELLEPIGVPDQCSAFIPEIRDHEQSRNALNSPSTSSERKPSDDANPNPDDISDRVHAVVMKSYDE